MTSYRAFGTTDGTAVPEVATMHRLTAQELPLAFTQFGTAHRVPHTKQPGYSSIYHNKFSSSELIDTIHPAIRTLHDVFDWSSRMYPSNDCLGERKFDEITGRYGDRFEFQDFSTIKARKDRVGSGVLAFVRRNKFRRQGHDEKFILTMYSKNRLEWLLTDLACASYSITNTSLYDTLGPETSEYIIELTQTPVVVCSKDKLDKLLQIKSQHQLPYFTGIVSMDSIVDTSYYKKFSDIGIELIDFNTLEKLGAQYPVENIPPTPETLYTLSFTSGTTGVPKGVMLTHATAVAGVSFAMMQLTRFKSQGQRYSLSFLPLAHIFERQMSMFSLSKGIGVGFPPTSDYDSAIQNLRILKPAYLTAVPRIYTRIEAAIKTYFRDNGITEADPSHRKRLRALFGMDNLEFCLTASAPISPRTMKLVSETLDLGFLQLYGCTETYGAATTASGREFSGSSGPIGCTCEIKLRGIPELDYKVESEDGKELDLPGGELLMRGVQIFEGYYKNEKATSEALDSEGWFHTGDVARLDHEGKLYIVDRVKNFFKLQQGEFIVPEKVENVYLSSNPMLNQLFVHGDRDKNFLIGIAGIDLKHVKELIQQKRHLHTHNVDDLINHSDTELIDALNRSPQLKKIILDSINNEIVHANLHGFEKLHNVYVDLEPLKLSADAMTPTMKLKRNNCRALFKTQLAQLYDEGSLISKTKL